MCWWQIWDGMASHLDKPDDSEERFVAVLEIPPVESAVTAVRASIVADAKKGHLP